MKKLLFSLLLLICGHLCAQNAAEINIIPMPAQMEVKQGAFTLSPTTAVVAKTKEAKCVAQKFVEKVNRATGWNLEVKKKASDPAIAFVLAPEVKGAEAYTLDVEAHTVTLRASTEAGLFYALQSLLQLLPPGVEEVVPHHVDSWAVPCVSIVDAPRFAYRGVMLDPCRHFLPVSAVKRQIDLLAAYKINRLHWHLTEDQGWRIESKSHPELNKIGSYRTEGDGSVTGGFYTQDEIRDVVAYAAEHYMEVVPELEIPGHELAAIATYPNLSCREEPITPRIIGGVEDVVMCPGKEDMFEFLQDIIDEMVPLFPSKYFHIGGDESPRGEWAACPKCQARMKAEGLTKEAELQTYVIHRIEKYLATKGKRIIGWDEILEGENLDTTAIVMSWRGEEGGIAAAKMGHQVLMTPSSHGFYFDHYQSDPQVEEYNCIGGYSTVNKVYAYDPVPEELRGTPAEKFVLGVQANNWSEYTYTPAQLEYKLYPRALALAEVAWTPLAKKDFSDFCRRMDGDAATRLRMKSVNYHIPVPEQPEGSCSRLAFTDEALLTLTTPRPLDIVFTTDGTAPTKESAKYVTPIRLTQTTTIRTAAVLPNGELSRVRTIEAVKGDYQKACTPQGALSSGLKVRKWEGRFELPSQLRDDQAKDAGTISRPQGLVRLTRVPGNVRDVADYAAEASGYLRIESDGVYEFSTNNALLLIDDRIVIDNTALFNHRHTKANAQVALAAGLHSVKILFLGGIYNFWPTYWDGGEVNIRPVMPTASPQSAASAWRQLGDGDFVN